MFRLYAAPVVVFSLLSLSAPPLSAAPPTVGQALRLKPVQEGVQFDTPEGKDVDECTIKAEKEGRGSGWIVRDSDGQTLRRFIDSNGDNVVDLWCYYQNGLEVYRDVDRDFNGKADEYRWLHTGGTRWGVDSDEDGQIDRWRRISAQEVSAEAVRAIATNDDAAFARLLLTEDELKSLDLPQRQAEVIGEKLADAKKEFSELARRQRTLGDQTKWLHFGALQPGAVPLGEGRSGKELLVYENATALVQTGDETAHVSVGTLVQVGDAWKLFEAPRLMDDDAVAGGGGFFFRASLANVPESVGPGAGAVGDTMQKLLAELEQLDKQEGATATPEAQARWNARRADVLEKLAEASSRPEDQSQWYQQLADTVSAAVQSGGYPDGVARLKQLHDKLATDDGQKDLAAYVKFRYLAADYGASLQAPNADFQKIQAAWLKNLEGFVADYPSSPDAAEALLQLGMAAEFSGQEDDSKKWYGRVVKEFPNTAAATKATGALARLDSVGKPISLKGPSPTGGAVDLAQLRGRVVLVHYWATWCKPCVADLKVIREMYSQHGRSGFVPVGVSLDYDKTALLNFLKSNPIPWPQIYEPGSLDSRPANEMGILTLPTMFLIDRQGRVVNRSLHIGELETELKKYLQ